jgi:hypothetical protein
MAMTKKHFEAIAALVKDQGVRIDICQEGNDLDQDEAAAAWRCLEGVANGLANMCANDNPNFDKQRFLTACGF